MIDSFNMIFKQLVLKNKYIKRDSLYMTKASKNVVNINAWVDISRQHQNIGDWLSFIIIDEMLKMNNIDIKKPVSKTKHLYGIGSQLLGFQDATIWGGGFAKNLQYSKLLTPYKLIHRFYHKTDIRAVRGPLSKYNFDILGINCPEIYGDPALLLPLFYTPAQSYKCKPFIIVPHYNDYNKYDDYDNVLNTFTDDWKRFVDELCSADLIISSSLHGIILAEAYGIPAIMIKNSTTENIFKYQDYYHSTGRTEFPIATSIEEALNITPSIPNTQIIKEIQKNLIQSFPYDLWE